MFLLCLGLVLFIGIHLVPSVPALHARLKGLGEGPSKGIFSLVALLGLTLVVLGKADAPFIPVWQPDAWTRLVPITVMWPALMLLATAYVPSNLKRLYAHPMLAAVVLWAAAHLVANGDAASMLLFGSIGAFAAFDTWSANRRGRGALATEPQPVRNDILAALVGSMAYVGIMLFHGQLFGVRVIG